ncbi:hypothetical protein [Bacillus sp. FJAT-26390]|uniref:hypothetical protein n=1 Tax=Bacillus sp. FJAT-26390 TaxID=1743142 RepID=UPI000807CD82|nr:hypothetical protein [Bacillus sp. FJAT-26390]OBZ10878.1 hypothetical protein A7975_17905 [Bacillus sp. FJAT-26390]
MELLNDQFLERMKMLVHRHTGLPLIEFDIDYYEKTTMFMGYNLNEKLIAYNLPMYEPNKSQTPELAHLSLEEFFEIAIYHEIGHHLDYIANPNRRLYREMHVEDATVEFILEGEVNAYKYGRDLVPDPLISYYDILNKFNIERRTKIVNKT